MTLLIENHEMIVHINVIKTVPNVYLVILLLSPVYRRHLCPGFCPHPAAHGTWVPFHSAAGRAAINPFKNKK
jgi:hypothetical protein